MSDGIRILELDNGNELQRTDKLYAVRGSGVGADKYVTIPLITDSGNTVLGKSSLANVTGTNNTVLGYNVGNTLVEGVNNILIGSSVDVATAATSNSLNIGGALTGTVGTTKTINSVGDFSVATNKLTVASATGNTVVAGTLGATGNFAVNTNKFNITATTGATSIAGSLDVVNYINTNGSLNGLGGIAINTNKFTVAGATGNTVVAGTLGVSGALTGNTGSFSSTLSCTGDLSVNTNKFTVAASTGNTVIAGTLGITDATTTNGRVDLVFTSASGKGLTVAYGGVYSYQFNEGTTQLKPVYTNTTASAANVYVDSNGLLSRSTSSRRFKENERPLEMDTSKIDVVEVKTFNMKDSGQLGHGPIAEDIAEIESNFATYDQDGRPEAIHTNNVLYSLLVEHRKLKNYTELLEERLAKLEAK